MIQTGRTDNRESDLISLWGDMDDQIHGMQGGMTKNPNVEKAVAALAEVRAKGFPYGTYEGMGLYGLLNNGTAGFTDITTLDELYAVLRQTWSSTTCFRFCQEDWTPADPSYGQCVITAALVCDMFGGTIRRIRNSDGSTHYFNEIGGIYVDLTREQFSLYGLVCRNEPNRIIDRAHTCRTGETGTRFRRLVRNIDEYLKA